jgi:hypothetical protein
VGTTFASAKNALGVCDICGFTYKLRTLRNLVQKGRDTNLKACEECWNPDHPQLKLGEFPVYDPQALRNPRPDTNQYAASRAQIIPVRSASDDGGSTVCTGFVGQVTVNIT